VTTPYGFSRGLLGAERHALSSQSGSKNIERGIMVPIADHSTPFTPIDAHRQRHHLSMPAVGAILCGVGRRHFDHVSLSFFRFSNERGEKGTPGCICNRCVQSSFAACPVWHILSRCFVQFGLGPFDHVAHGQGFDGDQPEALDQLVGFLLDEVLAPPADALMDSRHDLAPPASHRVPPLPFGETAVRFRQLVCFFPEKSGVVNLFASGEEGEGLESHIDPYMLIRCWQYPRLDLIAREAHKPLSRRVSHDAARFDDASCGPVLHHPEMPNLGKGEFALYIDAETRLGVGERSVAESGFIARVARRLASFHTREEGFEGFVDAMQHILQDLGVDGFIFWSDRFDGGQLGALLREGDALAAQPIGLFPLLQGGVVQLGAQGELLVQHAFLLPGRVETELIGFPHTFVFFSDREKRKLPQFQPKRNTAFPPYMGKQGLSAALVGR
jgi:hypothetical protein